MPPSAEKYAEVKFLYAQRMKRAARQRLFMTLAWLCFPPSALAFGIAAGRFIALHHLFGQ